MPPHVMRSLSNKLQHVDICDECTSLLIPIHISFAPFCSISDRGISHAVQMHMHLKNKIICVFEGNKMIVFCVFNCNPSTMKNPTMRSTLQCKWIIMPRIEHALLFRNDKLGAGFLPLIEMPNCICTTIEDLHFCLRYLVLPRREMLNMLKCLKRPSLFNANDANTMLKNSGQLQKKESALITATKIITRC